MKKWFIGISLALNMLILLVALGAWWFGGTLLARQFMQPMHDRWITQFEVLPVQTGDIVFLGDSITEGGIWEELFIGLPVRNRGISGDTTEGVLDRLRQVTDGRPAKVFLLIGTNDLSFGVSPRQVADNIQQIVDTILTDSPGTRVLVQSVLPRGADYSDSIEELNSLLFASITNRAEWIDLYPLFLDEADNSIRNDLSNDELHLLGQGYLLWREAIEAYVR